MFYYVSDLDQKFVNFVDYRRNAWDFKWEIVCFCLDTMLNYQVSQKLKPLGDGKFNQRLNKTLCLCFTYVTSFGFRALKIYSFAKWGYLSLPALFNGCWIDLRIRLRWNIEFYQLFSPLLLPKLRRWTEALNWNDFTSFGTLKLET